MDKKSCNKLPWGYRQRCTREQQPRTEPPGSQSCNEGPPETTTKIFCTSNNNIGDMIVVVAKSDAISREWKVLVSLLSNLNYCIFDSFRLLFILKHKINLQ